jgi:hypothetical protein
VTAPIPAHRRRIQINPKRALVLFASLVLVGGVAAAVTVAISASARGRLIGIYTGREGPAAPSASAGAAVELGVRFTVSMPGSVVAIRFYKARDNTGPHTGTLWTDRGQRVATVTFSHESRHGWQVARLNQVVALLPGRTYISSYHTTSGHYSEQPGAFAGGATIGNPTIRGTGGTYSAGAGFPSLASASSAYYVDVLFQPGRSGTPISELPTPTPTSTHPTPTPTSTHPTPTPPTSHASRPTTSTPAPPTTHPTTSSPSAGARPAACTKGGTYLWSNLARCGWPGPANTGPVASHCPSGRLSVNAGSASRTIRLTSANAVVSCQNITGCLDITAPNVTISNVQIACTSGRTGEAANGTGVIKIEDGASATISHVAIDGMDGVHACIWHQGTAMSATALNCHGIDDGIFSWADTGYSSTTGDHFTIKDSYFHDFTTKTANGHIDGYQTEGAANGSIRHNTYYMTSDDHNSTDSAIAIWNGLKSSHDITVSDNLIAGGGFSIYAEDYNPSESDPRGGFTVTNITFADNAFSTALYGCVGYFGVWFPRGNPSDSWHRSGNTVLETAANVDTRNPTYQGHSCT